MTIRTDTEILDYLLGDRSSVHPLFGGEPNIRDLCFTVFMRAKNGTNADDGGECDWINDTLPIVEAVFKKWGESRAQTQEAAT